MRYPGIPGTSTLGAIGMGQQYELAKDRQKLAKRKLNQDLAFDVANSLIGAAGTGFGIYGQFANRDLQRQLQAKAQAAASARQERGIAASETEAERGRKFSIEHGFPHAKEVAEIYREAKPFTTNIAFQGLVDQAAANFSANPTPENRQRLQDAINQGGANMSPEQVSQAAGILADPQAQARAYLLKNLSTRPEFSAFSEDQLKTNSGWGAMAKSDPALYARFTKEAFGNEVLSEDVRKAMALMLLRDQIQKAGMSGPEELLASPALAPESVPKVQWKPKEQTAPPGIFPGPTPMSGTDQYAAPFTKEQLLPYVERNKEREALKAVLQQLMQQYMGQ